MRGSLVIINLIPKLRSFLQRRMLEAVNEDTRHVLTIMVKNARHVHKNASRVTDRAQNYMLVFEDVSDLNVTLAQWKMLPTWNPLAQTVILIIEAIDTTAQKNNLVRIIFEELTRSGMMFINVMYYMMEDLEKMIVETWFPYDNKDCPLKFTKTYKIHECTVEHVFDKETNQSEIKKTLVEFNADKYPKIPSTLHACPLKVSTMIWEPFVVGNEQGIIASGLEILMLKTITEQMELNLTFNILSNEIQSAKISDDNVTGIYADLIQK